MKNRLVSLLALAPLVSSCASSPHADRLEGWRVLFDGTSTDAWRGYRQKDLPDGWRIQDGALVRVAAGGDIVTKEEFSDFMLSFEWRISPGGNSGVFFGVTEAHDAVWRTGPEYQILDNALHKDGGDARTSAAANYALHAPVGDYTRPVGEWNESLIVVDGGSVRHWLNGHVVVEYELWTPDWEARVAASKFGEMPAYGRSKRGHIALQDHGDVVAYRNIRIRSL